MISLSPCVLTGCKINNTMSNFAKIVIFLIVIFLIAAGFYFLRGNKAVAPATGLVKENFDSSDFGENQEFLRVLKNLERVSLDGSVLTTQAFLSLVDFSLELAPEPVGRINPFRPINPLERDFASFTNINDATTTSP